MSKRISYRDGVDFIAFNDNPGADDAFDDQALCGTLTVAMLAELSGKEQWEVAKDVVALRLKAKREGHL